MSRRLTDHRGGARRRRYHQPYNLFDSYPDDDLDLDADDDAPAQHFVAWDQVDSTDEDDDFADALWEHDVHDPDVVDDDETED